MTGIVIMVLAVAAFIACRVMGVHEVRVLRGASVQVKFSRSASALDDNYAILTVRVRSVLLAAFLVGLVLFLITGGAIAA
jgi:hypothetical protein